MLELLDLVGLHLLLLDLPKVEKLLLLVLKELLKLEITWLQLHALLNLLELSLKVQELLCELGFLRVLGLSCGWDLNERKDLVLLRLKSIEQ